MNSIRGREQPAYDVVTMLGGVTKAATICGTYPSTVSRWLQPTSKKGSGGKIPLKYWQPILDYAKQPNIEIGFEALVKG
jgi:hypothetical protein